MMIMELDRATGLLTLHVVAGVVLIGLGILSFLAGRPLGLLLQGLMGVLIIGAGIAVARLI